MLRQARKAIACRLERLGDSSRPEFRGWGLERSQPFRGVGYVKGKTAAEQDFKVGYQVTQPPEGRPRASSRMLEVPDLLGERLLDALDELEETRRLLKQVIRMIDPSGVHLHYTRPSGERRSI